MRWWLLFVCTLAHGETVTLEMAKKYAVEHNFEIQSLRHQVDEKRAASGKSRATFFPELGVAAGGDYGQGTKSAILGYVYGNFNLFRGFADTYYSQITSLDEQLAEAKLRQAEFATGLAVERAFHLYLFKKRAIEMRSEALRLNDNHKAMAARRRGAGLTADSDVMEFDLRESLIRSDVELLTQEKEEARIQLRRLLGEEIGNAIEPVGALQHHHLRGAIGDYMKRIQESSEAIRVASRELARATVESRLWRSQWLPQIDFTGEAGYLNLDNQPPNGGPGVKAMLVAKFNLFSGWKTAYELREGEAKKLRAEAHLKSVIQDAITATETAFRRLQTIQKRVDLEESNETRAERYYRAVVAEYGRGVKNSSDVRAASEQLFETRLRQENYKYQFLTEKLDLEQSLGGPVGTDLMAE